MVGGVDWITQTALGAAVGELMMGKRLGKRALAWGALFGFMPGLETVMFPLLDRARELACARGLGHSLILMPLASWWIAKGLAKLWKRDKIPQAEAWRFVLAVWSAHVLADCLGTEGAALGWPFSIERVAFNVLPPLDFLFSAPLVVAVLWMAFLKDTKARKGKKPPLAKRRKILHWGLGLSAGYLLLAVAMKAVASAGFEADLARRGIKPVRLIDSPTPFNILLWRAVVDRGDDFLVGYRTVFERESVPVRWTIYQKGTEALAGVEDLRETRTLKSMTDGWVIARPNVKGAWLGDMRFCETRIWGKRKDAVDSRLAVSWLIDAGRENNRLREIPPGNRAPDHYMRMARRVSGDHAAWEANPRLAGVAGSLPEFLPVVE